jgi:hypothetical protein
MPSLFILWPVDNHEQVFDCSCAMPKIEHPIKTNCVWSFLSIWLTCNFCDILWVGPIKHELDFPCVWVCLVMGCQLSHSRTKHLSWSVGIHKGLILLAFLLHVTFEPTFFKDLRGKTTMFGHGVIWTIFKRGLEAHKVM